MKAAIVVLALTLAACGSSKPTAAQQIRATEAKAIETFIGDHPERACQYESNHDACISGVVLLKGMKIEAQAALGIPDDWRDRVDRSKVVVTGDRATLSPGPTGKTAKFVRRGNQWLVVNS